jgi:hypothetical protein
MALTTLDPNTALLSALGLGLSLAAMMLARRFGRFNSGNAPDRS